MELTREKFLLKLSVSPKSPGPREYSNGVGDEKSG